MARPGVVRRVLLCAGALLALAAAAAGYVYVERIKPAKERAAGHQKMVALLADIERRTPEEHWLLNEREARELRAFTAAPPPGTSPAALCGGYYHLGMAELKLGREQEAIEAFLKAYHMLHDLKGVLKRDDALSVVFYLGVACMRLGETQNCCARHTPDSCLLPIQGGGIHTNPEGSRGAIGHFLEVLSSTQEREPAHLQARWLLNIAYMTLGEYPDKVPSEHLIPPQAFASDEPFPRFPNIAGKLGLDTFSLAGGAVADDFDNDGYLDLIVSSSDTSEHLRYFHNNQDGTFTDRSEPAGLTGLLGGLNMIQGDYNNDGNVDFLVLRGGWLFDKGRYPNSLVRNNGDGTFVDVTFSAGLGEVFYPKQTASFADYDNDGDLDIYIGNESTQKVQAPCQLFRNNGDETFTDVAREAGVTNDRFAKSVVWGDYDGDGLPDIYVGNLGEPNRLYHNLGNGTFVDMAPRLGVTLPVATFPTWFWDFDNDGVLDIFASSYGGDIADLAAAALGLPFESDVPHLYRGDGSGGFVEVGKDLGLRKPNFPMGANFGDLDGDGYLDFYLGTGDPDYMNLMPNVMYHNRRGKGFADVTSNGGFGNLQKGHAVVFADFDNDGDQDIFEQMGGAYRGDRYNDSFYENPGFGNHWISVNLVGVRSNRSGVGARIHVVILENGQPRSIYKHVNSGGSFGANPLRQNIGLGKATGIVSLEVLWPTTGKTQTFTRVAMDQFVELVEGAEQLRTIQLKKLKLGGGAAAEGTHP